MQKKNYQRGQAIILIAFGIVALAAITALAIDGGNAYSDRRNAQNSADTAALAGALAGSRGQNIQGITDAAKLRAASNSYDNNHISNDVTVTVTTPSPTACPDTSVETDISVQITSHVKTYFAQVVGIPQVTNNVFAISRVCGTYSAPIFGGDALVSLGTSGIDFNAGGGASVTVTGSGIFSNSSTCSPQTSVQTSNNTTVTVPSITMVANCSPSGPFVSGTETQSAAPYSWAAYKTTLPPSPTCADGAATNSGTNWSPKAGTTGSTIDGNAMVGDMNFAPGLYCIINHNPKNPGALAGTGVTFYSKLINFTLSFQGSGAGFGSATVPITAPTSGDYRNVLMFIEPNVINGILQQTQSITLTGNGNTGMVGSIIAPSAVITLLGNSTGSATYQTQFVGYQINTGGATNIKVNYNSSLNYTSPQPAEIQLIK